MCTPSDVHMGGVASVPPLHICIMPIQGPSQVQRIYIGNKHILELEQGHMGHC